VGRKTNDEFSVPPTLLGWSQDKLARSASIGLATLRRIEQNEGIVKGNFSTIIKIQRVLEQAGIHFTEDDPDPDVQIPLPVLHGRASLTVV
jgi:predicted transcriptional regulator